MAKPPKKPETKQTDPALEPGQLTKEEAEKLGQPYKAWVLPALLAKAGLEASAGWADSWTPEQQLEARSWAYNEINGDKSPPPQFVVDAAAASRTAAGPDDMTHYMEATGRLSRELTEARAEIVRLQEQVKAAKEEGFSQGVAEGRADIAVQLRKVVDPDDVDHLEVDGSLSRVSELIQTAKNLKAANDAMREPMRKLREAVAMPAQGEETVISEVLRRLDMDTPAPLPVSGWSSERSRELVRAVSVVDQPYLLGDLLVLLAPLAGQTGANEGAADVLSRLISERSEWETKAKKNGELLNAAQANITLITRDVERLQGALVARRTNDGSGEMVRAIVEKLGAHMEGITVQSLMGGLERVFLEWSQLRRVFGPSAPPFRALLLQDVSSKEMKNRFTLLCLEGAEDGALHFDEKVAQAPWHVTRDSAQRFFQQWLTPEGFRQ